MKKPPILIAIICLLTLQGPSIVSALDYLLGEGDLLKITVYEHPDLTTEVRLGADGKITFPLIGEITISELSTLEIEKLLVRELENGYIRKAHVTVFILEYKSKKVTVLGEFVRPGVLKLTGDSTLLEVISDAGGVTANAGDLLYIQRKDEAGEEVSLTVDLKKLLESGDVSANVAVREGDSIYVPKAAFVFVTGEVKKPGAYKVTPDLSVLKAITLAGGFTDKARKGKIQIIRKDEEGNEITTIAPFDELVLPDDIIMVPLSFF